MPEIQTPEWVKDAIFYQIFPDRFAKSDAVPKASGLQPWGAPPTPHGYQGGDLLGVAEHLDYLADLGINAIYFNPIFRSGVEPSLSHARLLPGGPDARRQRGIPHAARCGP